MTSSDTKILMRFRITTPMFCSAADIDNAELRLPSIKGLLRYWWRVSQSGSYSDPSALLKRENSLFGSTERQSQVLLRIIEKNLESVVKKRTVFGEGVLKGAYYLAYGCIDASGSRNKGTEAGELTRAMIPGGDFTLEARLPKKYLNEVLCSARLLGCFGGVGSKSRKGYGSISLASMKVGEEVQSVNLEQALKCVSKIPEGVPDWTAVSRMSRLIECDSAEHNSVQLLDQLGRELVHHRSWGRDGIVLGEESEKNFKPDHDLYYGNCDQDIQHPARVVFGLPHNYGKGIAKSVTPAQHERRASPVHISIYQPAEDQPPKAHILFLPSKFLPQGEKLMSFGRRVEVEDSDFDTFWSPINNFLDRLISTDENARKTSIRGREVRIG